MTYNINSRSDILKLNDAIKEKSSEVNVMDPTTKNPQELKKTYIGKHIAECLICKQLIYVDSSLEEEIDNELKACPYCGFDHCFDIVGVVMAEPKKNLDNNKEETV